jgi:hypothetical protein
MSKKNNGITLNFEENGGNNKRNRSKFGVIFLAVLIFVAVFIPVFGNTLRYQASQLFQNIFNFIGSISKLVGILLVGFGFVSLFTSRKINIEAPLFGTLLLWIGCFLTYTQLMLFDITIGDIHPPLGYH